LAILTQVYPKFTVNFFQDNTLRSKVSYITLMPGQVKDEFVDKLKVELGANKVGHGSGKCGTITNGIHWYVNVTLTPMWTNSHDITLR